MDLRTQRVLVREGKGGRDRLLPLADGLARVLTAYLDRGRPRLHPRPGERARLLNINGERLGYGHLFHIVAKAGRRAGLARSLRPHDLRHAMAGHLLKGGADLRRVQALLGHVSVATTELYTYLQPTDVVEEFRRTRPRARRREGLPCDGGNLV